MSLGPPCSSMVVPTACNAALIHLRLAFQRTRSRSFIPVSREGRDLLPGQPGRQTSGRQRDARIHPRCSVGWRIALLPPVEILVPVGIAMDQAHQLPPLSVTYRNWCPAITETPVPFLRSTQLGWATRSADKLLYKVKSLYHRHRRTEPRAFYFITRLRRYAARILKHARQKPIAARRKIHYGSHQLLPSANASQSGHTPYFRSTISIAVAYESLFVATDRSINYSGLRFSVGPKIPAAGRLKAAEERELVVHELDVHNINFQLAPSRKS